MQTAHQHQSWTPTWLKIAVLLVVSVGILLRFTNLDNKPFWWDETIFLLWSGGYTIDEVKTRLRSPPRVKEVERASAGAVSEKRLSDRSVRPDHNHFAPSPVPASTIRGENERRLLATRAAL